MAYQYGIDGISNVMLGKGGPLIKNDSGIISCRNNLDTAYAIMRGASGSASNDCIPKGQMDAATHNLIRGRFVETPYNGGIPDIYTKLALYMDDSGLSDSSQFENSVTLNGGVARSAVQSKFGGYSALFDGDGDFLSVPDSDNWDLGSGNFTINFWIYFNNTDETYILWEQGLGTGGNPYQQMFFASNTLVFYAQTASVIKAHYSASWSPNTGQWYNVELGRNGTNIYMFIDGVSQSLTVDQAIGSDAMPSVDTVLTVGGRYNGTLSFDGYMDEFMWSKGIVRNTSNFTVDSTRCGGQFDIGGAIPAGSICTACIVPVTTVFDGTSPIIMVGDSANPERILSSSEVSLTSVAITNKKRWVEYAAETQLIATLDLQGASQGGAYVLVEYVS